MLKKLKFWIPVLLWMLLIFFLSDRKSVRVADEYVFNFLFFKTLHVIEYGILFSLIIRAIKATWPKMQKGKIYGWGFGLTLAYAITDELHQTFVPTREGKTRDVIIDAVGATLAWIFLQYISPKLPKRLGRWVGKWLN